MGLWDKIAEVAGDFVDAVDDWIAGPQENLELAVLRRENRALQERKEMVNLRDENDALRRYLKSVEETQ